MAESGFQLGKTSGGEPLVVDPRDLTTHAVIVGMTGSGKTGLGIVLLEEALAAGVPALVLDPKGDMGNLLLTFPDLDLASFRPWVSDSDAREAGLSIDDYAAKVAGDWREGLAASGIGPERIQALRDAAELTIYTPGSSAGVPLNVVGSLKAPPLSWESEAETLRDEIEGIVTSLLGLVGIAADPLSSREHVLLSNLVENAWRAGRDLDLGALIGEIQSPPLRRLGVFEIDAFFPPKERTELALKLNALVASPSFAAWGEGAPLDPAALLGGDGEKPRAAIVYLAHLSEDERQFVVTLILSKLVTWMRGLPGTSDLRALVYMDEVFGFVPPTAAPPRRSRSSRSSSRRARSVSAWCSRRRIPSTSTTRRCRTRAPGSSGACRPSATRSASSRGCAPRRAARTSRRSTRRSAGSGSGSSCSSAPTSRSRSSSRRAGRCRTYAAR